MTTRSSTRAAVCLGYALTFAVLLLTGAALGDRFGRRRLFTIGIGAFTVGSIGAALIVSRSPLQST